jgi:hypothetical protein
VSGAPALCLPGTHLALHKLFLRYVAQNTEHRGMTHYYLIIPTKNAEADGKWKSYDLNTRYANTFIGKTDAPRKVFAWRWLSS